MRQRALRSIVGQDLSSAIAEIETLPAGAARDEMLFMVARALVREDTVGALQWAEQVQHRVPGAFDQVINAMSAVDRPQAVTLALSQPGGEGRIGRWLTSASLSRMDTADFQPLADTLHAEGASQSAAVARLMMFCAERDGDAALTWLVEQGGAIDEDHVRGLATGFLRKDISLAAGTVRAVTSDFRRRLNATRACETGQSRKPRSQWPRSSPRRPGRCLRGWSSAVRALTPTPRRLTARLN